MLTGLGLRNFKAFGDEMQEAPLSKITLIYGPNSGGKSSIIQALLLLRQSLKSSYTYKERFLVPRGEYTDLGSFQSLMHKHDIVRELEISLKYQARGELQNEVAMRFSRTSELASVSYKITSEDSVVPLLTADSGAIRSNRFGLSQWLFDVMEKDRRPDIDTLPKFLHYFALPNLSRALEKLQKQLEELSEEASEVQESLLLEIEKDKQLLWDLYSKPLTGGERLRFEEEYENEIAQALREQEAELNWQHEPVWELNQLLSTLVAHEYVRPEDIPNDYERFLRSITYLGPLRSAPERLYRLSSEDDRSLGVTGIQGEFSANALYHSAYFRKEINRWFDKFDIPYDLVVKTLGGEPSLAGEHITIALTDRRTDTQVTIADVGYGINQLLPIIIEGVASPEGSILCVEQPEIHLHPRLQANIADLMINTLNAGKQWIVETHSELLIQRIRTRIAEGVISPSDVSVLYVDPAFDPDNRDYTGSSIKSLRLDENGYWLDEWPQGFFDDGYNESMAAEIALFNKDNENAR